MPLGIESPQSLFHKINLIFHDQANAWVLRGRQPANDAAGRRERSRRPCNCQTPTTIARPYVTIAQVASEQPVAGVGNTRNGGLLPPRISPVGQLALGPPVGCTLLIIRRDARPTPAFERVDPLDRVEELARKRKARPPGGEFRRRPV